jgi:hypothetical protein
MLLETQRLIDNVIVGILMTKGVVCQDLVAKQNTWAMKQEVAQPSQLQLVHCTIPLKGALYQTLRMAVHTSRFHLSSVTETVLNMRTNVWREKC